MVDRCMITESSPCTVVDLDGTYVKGNTLKIYLKCGLRYLSRHNKYMDFGKVLFGVVKRQLRLSTHLEMRNTVIGVLYQYNDGVFKDFSDCVAKHTDPTVKSLIEERVIKGHRILLATAASGIYVPYIWGGDFVADCRGMEKLRRVMQWLADNNCMLDTVVTDHSDDLPLLEANKNGTNILVNPSVTTLALLHGVNNISVVRT